MSSSELLDSDVDLLELLHHRRWEEAASLLRERAAKGGRISLHWRTVEALAYRLTEDGRKKSRGRQCDPLIENLVLGGEIERELQGTSPIEAFKDFLGLEQHIPNPVPQRKRLKRLNEIAQWMGNSQSKAEKARAAYNRFLKVANQADPPEDPPNS
jgi:hypothetical protein